MTQINEYNIKPANEQEFLRWESTRNKADPMPDNIKAYIYAMINEADVSMEKFISESIK